MLRKSILIALAATATLGAAMLTSTAASAMFVRGGGHGGWNGGHGGWNGGHGGWNGGHGGWHRPVVWHRPIVYGAPVVYAVARPIAAAAAPTCNCLTKEYTPEGAVLFKDNCTNEAAMSQAAQQQTGMVDPQQMQQPR